MNNTIDALRNLYVALGGEAEDVANLVIIPELIDAIASLAEGGGGGGGGKHTITANCTGCEYYGAESVSASNKTVTVVFKSTNDRYFEHEADDISVEGASFLNLSENALQPTSVAILLYDIAEDVTITAQPTGRNM